MPRVTSQRPKTKNASNTRPQRIEFNNCYATLAGDTFICGNSNFERRWKIQDKDLYPTSFRDLQLKKEWISPAHSLAAPTMGADQPLECSWELKKDEGPQHPVQATSLICELIAGNSGFAYRFQIFPEASGVAIQVIQPQTTPPAEESFQASPASATGVEKFSGQIAQQFPYRDRLDSFAIASQHLKLLQGVLMDQTDIRNEILFENEWLLHSNEREIKLSGNVFAFEETLTGKGCLLFKEAPLPHSQPISRPHHLIVSGKAAQLTLEPAVRKHASAHELKAKTAFVFAFYGHGLGSEAGAGYRTVTLSYSGGSHGRIEALQRYQEQLRAYQSHRDGMLVSNTWGDRNKDGRVSETFLREEIIAAAKLGVDVVQVDDGWQAGITSNSVEAGGVWEGFWKSNPRFWEPHSQRFPNGLEPLVKLAKEKGMKFGLWYAPDSFNDFSNWERDANQILELHRKYSVDYFKMDSVELRSKIGEARIHQLYQRVLQNSQGKITLDSDATAGQRPSLFGNLEVGTIFIENRYTDCLGYWPHQTLRNLWNLAHYVHPVLLRMEFLNHARNAEFYGKDPLAPSQYSPAYLFATTMFASPLGWFEVSQLPKSYLKEAAPLISLWKQHRSNIFKNPILPIGERPNGTSWTGFVSIESSKKKGYFLIFREFNEQKECWIELPLLHSKKYQTKLLAGTGKVSIDKQVLRGSTAKPRSFLFGQFSA
jgi:alpha-galactosidase